MDKKEALELLKKATHPDLPYAKEVIDRLQKAGYKAYIVGGFVREVLLGKQPKDIDLTTDAKPDEILAVFPKEKLSTQDGLKHGTCRMAFGPKRHNLIEVTSFRRDVSTDGRHAEIEHTKNLDEDLGRRDFSANSIAWDSKDSIIDPHDGLKHISEKVLKTVGKAEDRFAEDFLRMLRAVRFGSTTGFKIDPEVVAAIKKHAPSLSKISQERIRDEFNKILTSNHPVEGLDMLRDTGLLDVFMPEGGKKMLGVKQNEHHKFEVKEHIDEVIRGVKPDLVQRLSAFFHDIAKPDTYTDRAFKCLKCKRKNVGRHSDLNSKEKIACQFCKHEFDKKEVAAELEKEEVHFYEHEKVGADVAYAVMTRMKYPNDIRDKVVEKVRKHQDIYNKDWKNKDQVIGFVRDLNIHLDHLSDLFKSDIDAHADHSAEKSRKLLDSMHGTIKELGGFEKIKGEKPLIDGKEIMELLQLTPGPTIKEAREALIYAQLKGQVKSKEDARYFLLKKYKKGLLDGSEIMSLLDVKTGPEVGKLLEVLLREQSLGHLKTKEDAKKFMQKHKPISQREGRSLFPNII